MQYHPIFQKIKNILETGNIWFETFEHEPVRTSEEAAKVRNGYTLSQGAKALILRVKGQQGKKFIMLVIPGNTKFDKNKVKKELQIKDLRFATEKEISEITDGIKIGGIPPFGDLFGLQVFSDKELFRNERIIFNAGDRCVSVAMLAEDYKNLVKPQTVHIIV